MNLLIYNNLGDQDFYIEFNKIMIDRHATL